MPEDELEAEHHDGVDADQREEAQVVEAGEQQRVSRERHQRHREDQ
jgi:hypothetical protein